MFTTQIMQKRINTGLPGKDVRVGIFGDAANLLI